MPKAFSWPAAACAIVLLTAGNAAATTWLVDYSSTGGAPHAANLSLTVADVQNGAGTYDVLGVTGNVDGDAVTGLIANPNQPGWAYSSDGLFMFDNTFQANGPNISWYGLLFQSATNEYNLFSDSPTQYELYKAADHSYVANSLGAITVAQQLTGAGALGVAAAVPEPGTWALLIAGFGMIGAAIRAAERRRRLSAINPVGS